MASLVPKRAWVDRMLVVETATGGISLDDLQAHGLWLIFGCELGQGSIDSGIFFGKLVVGGDKMKSLIQLDYRMG